MKRKYSLLKEKNIISYYEWKETNKGWEFLKSDRYVGKFLKEDLTRYHIKNIRKAEAMSI